MQTSGKSYADEICRLAEQLAGRLSFWVPPISTFWPVVTSWIKACLAALWRCTCWDLYCDNRDAGLLTKLYFRRPGQGQKACINLLAKRVALRQTNVCFLRNHSFANKTDADCCHPKLFELRRYTATLPGHVHLKCGGHVLTNRATGDCWAGCHGLHVDTGRWENNVHLDRKDRWCLVCKSSQHVEDEHHFIFDCPLYSHIRARHASLFRKLLLCQTFC